jgi:hypothetical protein
MQTVIAREGLVPTLADASGRYREVEERLRSVQEERAALIAERHALAPKVPADWPT